MKYGNYLGNKYNRYALEPIDDLDYACFLHDIDHSLSCGNNRFADRELYKRLKKIDPKNLTIKGKLFYFFARYIYTLLYAWILRDLKIVDYILIKIKAGETEYYELKRWNNSFNERMKTYIEKEKVFNKTYIKLY